MGFMSRLRLHVPLRMTWLTLQDEHDFDIATTVFWTWYFVYQRGEEKKRRDDLFKQFVKPFIPSAVWDDEWEERFHLGHNTILHGMAQAVDVCVKRWEDSDAGEIVAAELRHSM